MARLVTEPCGSKASAAGYRRHLRHGEVTCPDCRKAHAEYVATFRRSRMSYRRTVRRLPRSVRKAAA
jgi:hypothetical protein